MTQNADIEKRDAEELALEAERRAEEAVTQDEREKWLRIAAEWWNKA